MAVRTRWYVGAELLAIVGVIAAAMVFDAGWITMGELIWAAWWLLILGFGAVYLINLEYNRACSRERHRRMVEKSTEYVIRYYERANNI